MEYKEILNLMKEMNSTDLTKLEIEEESFRICIEKAAPVMNIAQPAVFAPSYSPTVIPQPQATIQSQAGVAPVAGTADAVEKQEELSGKKIVSPMVGTFYASPSPDKPAFAKVGDKVKKGQTVCIIEAMKLMNEIESDLDGEIVKVLVNNEEMVEFGQPLFLVK